MNKLSLNTMIVIILIFTGSIVLYADPKIDFDNKVINLGENEMIIDIGSAKRSTVISYEISFTNKGTSNLIIHSLEACCGRRAELLTGRETAPGKTRKIRFSFNTRNRTGSIMEGVVVNTNQPDRKKVTIFIRVNVQ